MEDAASVQGGVCGIALGHDHSASGQTIRAAPEPYTDWCTRLVERAREVFDGRAGLLKVLHAKIGQSALGIDF